MCIIPNTDHKSTPFFSPVPRHVLTLCQNGALKPRDVEVLSLLLDYKSRTGTVVEPRQDTMAKRLRCSTDTIQRSLSRLVKAGLILKTRARDLCGRLGKCLYDLAAVFALMPRKAAKVRHGEYGAAAAGQSQTPPATMPQKSGVSIGDLVSVCQADNGTQAETVTPPLVVELIKEGVGEKTAQTIHEKYGAERIRDVVNAARANRRATNRPGWIVAALTQGWAFQAHREAQERPKSQMPYQQTWRGGVAPSEVRNASRESFQQWRAAKLKKAGAA